MREMAVVSPLRSMSPFGVSKMRGSRSLNELTTTWMLLAVWLKLMLDPRYLILCK